MLIKRFSRGLSSVRDPELLSLALVLVVMWVLIIDAKSWEGNGGGGGESVGVRSVE